MREVVKHDGLTLPEGTHLPRGSLLGVSLVGVHTDERFYSKPNGYDPFRFVRSKVIATPENGFDTISNSKAPVYRKNVNLATCSDIFLSFGYGRHSW